MNMWKESLSINESKVSVLMIAFLSFIALAIYTYITKGDIPDSMETIIFYLGGAITSINAIDKFNSKK